MKTILLIDDDATCRLSAAGLLSRAEWRVLEADNGEAGIAAAIAHRPDAILCDLVMPKANGCQVCATLRQHPELRETPIIVVSGRDFDSDRRSAVEAGADDYLVKPLDGGTLRQTLARHLSRGGRNGALAAPCGPPHGRDVHTRVKFWGVRGSIPTPGPDTVRFGGNTSCVEVRADGETIILDAGSGIRLLGLELAAEARGEPIDATLLITHTHWDHIQGFPFFLPAYDAKNRLRILGVEGAHASLAATLAGQMESPYFPIALKQMPGHIEIEELRELRAQLGAVRVEACQTNHPDIAYGYRLFTSAGSLVYLPDNETPTEDAADRPGYAERRARMEQLREFVRGADLLICDSQYDAEEYKTHIGWGHGCVDEVVRFAIAADVKCLHLFHHDPAHDDVRIAQLLEHARELAKKLGSALQVEAAREGEEVVLRAKTAA